MNISREERERAWRIACLEIEPVNLDDWLVYERLWRAVRDELLEGDASIVAADVSRELARRLRPLRVVK